MIAFSSHVQTKFPKKVSYLVSVKNKASFIYVSAGNSYQELSIIIMCSTRKKDYCQFRLDYLFFLIYIPCKCFVP